MWEFLTHNTLKFILNISLEPTDGGFAFSTCSLVFPSIAARFASSIQQPDAFCRDTSCSTGSLRGCGGSAADSAGISNHEPKSPSPVKWKELDKWVHWVAQLLAHWVLPEVLLVVFYLWHRKSSIKVLALVLWWNQSEFCYNCSVNSTQVLMKTNHFNTVAKYCNTNYNYFLKTLFFHLCEC